MTGVVCTLDTARDTARVNRKADTRHERTPA